ncbi:MAG: VOC family protein [Gemmatimonadota bacterium]
MTEIQIHAQGTFSWFELVANDAPTARRFYTALLDWEIHEIPMSPGSVYTIFRMGGRDVAAMYPRDPEDMKRGPTHWRSYVAVTSADEKVEKARELEGEILNEPFDVMGVGRMAMIQDPTGASFALWQGKSHPGVGRIGEPGAHCWNELLTRDVDRAAEFYSRLFGWGVRVQEFGGTPYTMFTLGDQPIAGALAMPESAEAPPSWLVYWGVSDCDDRVKAARADGAVVHVEPTDVPGVGRFAVLSDPRGAVFALVQQVSWA